MAKILDFFDSLILMDTDQVPLCQHPSCKKEAKFRVHSNVYCSEWCHKNSIVLENSKNQQRLTHKEYSCQAGCGRHRGIKKDGSMFQYCSQECHQRATQSQKHHFQQNYQASNSQLTDFSQHFPQLTQHQGHVNCRPTNQFSWDSILFYDKDLPYYEFTNFYICRIALDDNVWPSTEHYFQAQKFICTPYYCQIRDAQTPRQAFEISRCPDAFRWKRSDWDEIKNKVMLKALLAKFLQHDNLRNKLVRTGKRLLVENSPLDWYWGIGSDGRGENYLGKLLMQVREICSGRPQKPHAEFVGDLIDLTGSVGQTDDQKCLTNQPSTSRAEISNNGHETAMETDDVTRKALNAESLI